MIHWQFARKKINRSFRSPSLSTLIYKQLLQMVSTRKKKKNKKRFRLLNIFFPSCWPGSNRTIVRVQARGGGVPPGTKEGECTGGRPREEPMIPRFGPGVNPEHNNCSRSGPERSSRPAESPGNFQIPGQNPNNYTVSRVPIRGCPRAHRRKDPANPQKPYPEAPIPNKSTSTRPRAGPEHRLLPPHGVCGIILPYPAYLALYLVPHVQ